MTIALFLLDVVMNAAMLRMAAGFEGKRVRPVRLFLGALCGAAIAWMARLMELSRAQQALLWLPAAAAMTAAARGGRAIARRTALLMSAAGLLGGTLLSLQGAWGSLFLAYALGGLCIAAMTASLSRARRAAQDMNRIRIICIYRGRTARFEAMIDSGNTLRDYLTHDPVIVMPEALGRRLFGLRNETLRPIFADTAGGRCSMELFVPEETILLLHGTRQSVRAAVALSGAMDQYAPVLAPASLIESIEA